MNLHGIVASYIGSVNPLMPVLVQISTGPSIIAADGTETPTYAADLILSGQIQPIQTRDLMQLDGVNLGGVHWKIYLNGQVDSIVRPEKKGGDLIVIPSGRHAGTWLVVQVLEQFPDWVCAAIVFQSTDVPAPSDSLTTDLSDPNNEVIVPTILTGV